MKIASALNRALSNKRVEVEDVAAIELARHYARSIDRNPDMDWHIGPRLLEVLVELGMTPKARNSVMKGGVPADGDSNKISELRSRRESRAAHLDAASS